MLFFWCVGVGSKGRTQSGLYGFLAHGTVDDIGAFFGDIGPNDLTSSIDPNVDHNLAFFTEIVVGAV